MLTHIPFSWAVDGPPVGDKAVGISDAGEADGKDWAEDQAVGVGDAGGKDLDEDKGVGEGDAVVETVDDGQGVV